MINIVNKIKKAIQEYDSTIDVRDGSAISDLLIDPLSQVLAPYETTLNAMLGQLRLTDPENIPDEMLDAIGATFLQSRTSGSKASGYIYIYFSEPRPLSLTKGAIFTTESGLQFETAVDYTITRTQMQLDTSEYPYYFAGPILVYSLEAGESYNVDPFTVFTASSRLNTTPVKITNKTAFTSGSDSETNAQFLSRIKRAVYGNSLASPAAIKNIIQSYSEDILDVEIVGAGDPYMYRDMVISYSGLTSNYYSEDFNYTISGRHDGYYKANVAYTGSFNDVDTSVDIAFPTITSWSREFSDEMYQGIYLYDDNNWAETANNVIINQFNESITPEMQNNMALLLASGLLNGWYAHDGANPGNGLFYADEVRVENKKMILGKTKDTSYTNIFTAGSFNPTAATNTVVNVPLAELISITTIAESLLTDKSISVSEEQLKPVTTFLKFYSDVQNSNNLSPVIHKNIENHTGIIISCDMATTDSSDYGEIAYITVLRNDVKHVPHDGFGLAWRKQPAYLIRMNKNNYATAAERQADLDEFFEDFGIDGTSYLGNISDPSNNAFWRFNVYIVDNNVLQEEAWIGYEQIWNQASGKNQFLEAAKVWIEDNRTYTFQLEIGQYLSVRAWAYDKETGSYDVNNPNINRGVTYPNYVPAAGQKFTVTNGAVSIDATRGHFGIGVGQTRNCEWTVSNLLVRSFTETFAMHLFKFYVDPTKFTDLNSSLNIKYWGLGYDPTQSELNPTGKNSKVKVGVYNVDTDTWETLGTHTEGIPAGNLPIDVETIGISGVLTPASYYVDGENYLYVAAMAANAPENISAGEFLSNYEHNLRTYYVKIDNDESNYMHRGNATDIYCHDPSNVSTTSAIFVMNGRDLTLNASLMGNHCVQEILEVRDYLSQVPYSSSDYVIFNMDRGDTYSSDAQYKISFNQDLTGVQIEVIYRYWTRSIEINNLIVNSENRYPNADYKVKIMPPTVVTISSLEYAGGLTEKNMKLKIKEFFNELDSTTFDKSDLVNLLYANGATYVNLDMEISIREYNILYKRNDVEMTAQSYTIPSSNLTRFYTDIAELYGVTKV